MSESLKDFERRLSNYNLAGAGSMNPKRGVGTDPPGAMIARVVPMSLADARREYPEVDVPRTLFVIAAHPIQQRIMDLVQGKGMDDLSLRAIAAAIGDPQMAPQKIKHHLGQLVKYGFLNIVGGKYRMGRLPR